MNGVVVDEGVAITILGKLDILKKRGSNCKFR